ACRRQRDKAIDFMGESSINRNADVKDQPGQHTSTITIVQVRLLGDKTPSAPARQTFRRSATATSVPTRHSPAMREMSVTEQRYKAVLAVIADGRTVSEVASVWCVCRQTMQRWLAGYEGDGLGALGNRS